MAIVAYLTLTGEKQGKIDGGGVDPEQAAHKNTILVQGFQHEISIPRNTQTGLPEGRREHRPLTILKKFDKASPKLYQALCSGERLKDVTIKWFKISSAGTEEHYFTHKLEEAIIVAMGPTMANCLDPTQTWQGHMESVSFTYRKITWTWVKDGIESEDDYKAAKA